MDPHGRFSTPGLGLDLHTGQCPEVKGERLDYIWRWV